MTRKGIWRTTGPRAAAAFGLALGAAVAGTASSASAAAGPLDDRAVEWGTVVKTEDGLQANAWQARLRGLGGVVDARLFEAADPATPQGPKTQAGGAGLIDLAPGGLGIGKGSALASRAFRNAVPQSVSGKEKVPAPGVAYADAGGASVDVGLPYVGNRKGGTQLSPIGVHVDACRVTAVSQPGKAVKFDGGAARGYISSFGHKIIDIPPLWAVNLGARIPADQSVAPFALVTTNEQVTTDQQGRPTLDPKTKHYLYDPKATSGYVNGIHVSVLGPEVADATVWHAAVIRDPKKTDSLAPKLPKLPGFVQDIISGKKAEQDAKKPMPQFPQDQTWIKGQTSGGAPLWGKLPAFDEDDS